MRDSFRALPISAVWRTVVERIGILYALIDFTRSAPYVLVGSHLDSQPRGGQFDSAYGVLAGLAAAKRLQDHFAQTSHPTTTWLSLTRSTRRAGVRAVAHGQLGLRRSEGSRRDARSHGFDPVKVRDALTAIGGLGTDEPPPAAGYVEIHIEQGRILERKGIPLGAVDSSWYTQKLDIEVLGEYHTPARP